MFFDGTFDLKEEEIELKKRYLHPPVTTVKNVNAKSIVARELKILKLSL